MIYFLKSNSGTVKTETKNSTLTLYEFLLRLGNFLPPGSASRFGSVRVQIQDSDPAIRITANTVPHHWFNAKLYNAQEKPPD